MAAVCGPIAAFERLEVAELYVIEAFELRAKPSIYFWIPACGDGRHGAAVEGARR